jgi:hypothetical protein
LSERQGEACERQRSDRDERTHLDAFPGGEHRLAGRQGETPYGRT